MTDSQAHPDLDGALDRALRQALRPPQVPPGFRTRLNAARARVDQFDLSELRIRFEREQREALERLEADYVRIRRATLGTLIGAAFAAGAATSIAMPWLRAHLGAYTPLVLAWSGVAIGLGIAFASLHGRLAELIGKLSA